MISTSPGIVASSSSQRGGYLDDLFLERVRRAYRLSAPEAAISPESVWKGIAALNRPVHDALMATDNNLLRGIFADPVSSDLFYGMDTIALSLVGRSPEKFAFLVEAMRGCLLLLAEAIGIRRWLPPESEHAPAYYPVGYEVSPNIDRLLDGISESLCFDVQFPNPFQGEVGASTVRGTASERAVQALYQCHRIKQEMTAAEEQSVLEIGPGMGRAAYYSRQAGIVHYTTIDLPLGVVAQACFLGATLGPESIWMVGDDPRTARGRVRLFPITMIDRIGEHFTLVVNVDSITEMGLDTSASFACWISQHADMFLSINHEANIPTVSDLFRRYCSARTYRRFPYWMRRGYVEEIFDFSQKR